MGFIFFPEPAESDGFGSSSMCRKRFAELAFVRFPTVSARTSALKPPRSSIRTGEDSSTAEHA